MFVFAILRAHKRFYGLRDFAVEGGQSELDRQAARRKQEAEMPDNRMTQHRNSSMDSIRSPTSVRAPSLSDVPEEGGAFAIGDDEDSDDEQMTRPTPPASSRNSRATSIAESAEDALPSQMGGMSEKARGKMPASTSSFSRVTSNASIASIAVSNYNMGGRFEPSAGWVRYCTLTR